MSMKIHSAVTVLPSLKPLCFGIGPVNAPIPITDETKLRRAIESPLGVIMIFDSRRGNDVSQLSSLKQIARQNPHRKFYTLDKRTTPWLNALVPAGKATLFKGSLSQNPALAVMKNGVLVQTFQLAESFPASVVDHYLQIFFNK